MSGMPSGIRGVVPVKLTGNARNVEVGLHCPEVALGEASGDLLERRLGPINESATSRSCELHPDLDNHSGPVHDAASINLPIRNQCEGGHQSLLRELISASVDAIHRESSTSGLHASAFLAVREYPPAREPQRAPHLAQDQKLTSTQ